MTNKHLSKIPGKELVSIAQNTLILYSVAIIAFTLFLQTSPGTEMHSINSAVEAPSLKQPKLAKETIVKIPTPTSPPPTSTPAPQPQEKEWGVAKQIDEVTWTMNVESDEKMGTPQEITQALNAYRARQGVGQLTWDDRLATYAQSRANHFAQIGSTDKHAGFNSFLDEGGFNQLGFNSLGENSSFGYHLEGVHLIEWVYAGDAPHDNNQLNPKWTHVGVGVNGTATDIIFAGNKR